MPSPSAHAAPHTPESGKFPEPPTNAPAQREEPPRTAVPARKPVPEATKIETNVAPVAGPSNHHPKDSVDSPISPKTTRNNSRMAGLPSLLTTNLAPGSNRPTPVRKAPPTPLELVNSNIRPSFSKPIERPLDEDEDSDSDAGSVEELVYQKTSTYDAQRAERRSPGTGGDDSDGSMLHTPEDKKGPPNTATLDKKDWGQSPATAGLDRKPDWGGREVPQSATFAQRNPPTPKSAPIMDREEFYK